MQLKTFNKKFANPKGLELVKIVDYPHPTFFFWLVLDPSKDLGQLDNLPNYNIIQLKYFSHFSVERWLAELDLAVAELEKATLPIAS